MSLSSERRRRLVDAAFATFGDAAEWSHLVAEQAQWVVDGVTVRCREQDQDDRFGAVSIIRRSIIIRVRSWEVETPEVDQVVDIADGRWAGSYVIAAKPMLDKSGVWECPANRQDII
jgi:hypothetical protein